MTQFPLATELAFYIRALSCPFLYLLLLGLFLWESEMWVGEREEEEEAPFFLKGEAEEAEVVVVEPSGNFSRVTSSFPYI